MRTDFTKMGFKEGLHILAHQSLIYHNLRDLYGVLQNDQVILVEEADQLVMARIATQGVFARENFAQARADFFAVWGPRLERGYGLTEKGAEALENE